MYDNVHDVHMTTDHTDTTAERSPAVTLGDIIRQSRKARGWTISEFADKLGRPREWLNRVELGYSEYGEYKPASLADLHTIIDCLGDALTDTPDAILSLGTQAEEEYLSFKAGTPRGRRTSFGKLTQTEVIIGERQIMQAITDLINEQHSDAIIRNTGVKGAGTYMSVTEEWKRYRAALGNFLSTNRNALFKRVEFAATRDQLQKAKEADEKLAGNRKLADVHNAKVKFHKSNPLQMHVVIGQREAILALPQASGQAGSNIAILVRDKIFVEALRVWYDEVLWDAPGDSRMVDFSRFDDSFADIAQMYDH